MKALILGVGNVLLGDEGIGIRIAEELTSRFNFSDNIEVLDGGTAGIELLRYIDGKDVLILVDAMKAGYEPGTVYRVDDAEVPKRFMEKISPHQIGLSDLLAAGILSDCLPARIILFAVEPKSLDTGIYLSKPVSDSIDKIINAITDELSELGFAYTAIPPEQIERKSLFWS